MPRFSKRNDDKRVPLLLATRRSHSSALAATSVLCLTTTGCRVVEGIFKAGFWVGAVVVILVIALVVFVMGKLMT